MAKSTFQVLKCDRCDDVIEDRSGMEIYAWGRINVEQVNGPLRIGGGGQKPVFFDICPKCLREVCTWFDRALPAPPSDGGGK